MNYIPTNTYFLLSGFLYIIVLIISNIVVSNGLLASGFLIGYVYLFLTIGYGNGFTE